MKQNKYTLTFLSFCLYLYGIFPVFADTLSFYSDIDSKGGTLSSTLTKRYLSEYKTFENFGRACREPIAWLDTSPMDESMLVELTRLQYTKILALINSKKQNSTIELDSPQFMALTSCLSTTYKQIVADSNRQQSQLETTSMIGVYMDGDTKNSDFDIIDDIKKIDAIIFTTPSSYNGQKNPTKTALENFLSGKKAPSLFPTTDTVSGNIKNSGSGSTTSPTNSGGAPTVSSSQAQTNPWGGVCLDPTKVTNIDNILDTRFTDDLLGALGGQESPNYGVDYSKTSQKNGNTTISAEEQEDTNNRNNTSKNDFFHSLPCSGVFCITVNIKKSTEDLLIGGNSYAIESILDKHIKKLEKVSWTDLSGQKMTNNSFQLPFLNIQFKSKIAGGGLFMHNSPQITKKLKSENTPEKKINDFDVAYRCAAASASLSSDPNKNNGLTGQGYVYKTGHSIENFNNATLPIGPLDTAQLKNLNGCNILFLENIRREHYAGFSRQIDELQAFTESIMDVIGQIVDVEKKLDTISST